MTILNDNNAILRIFQEANAIRYGHFVLSSGLHSNIYIQCAKLFESPKIGIKICSLLVKKIKQKVNDSINVILTPAIGGIVLGYEIGRQLGIRTIFCERVNGVFKLRRDFQILQCDNILLIEDVITTGKSSLEAVQCIEGMGGKIITVASLIKRNDNIQLPFPIISLIEINIKNYSEENLTEELKQLPINTPGSRKYLTQNSI
ncbi:orotate phosphoribosyltransferase [Wolbachia endosymbiont of Howardula sp.]|uniref:orotate phosphoribosyltransferase n=1 Tax=Wolbachia endosymbiont of Howardula sp. TaxID=2916816 RepID=UPI00217EEC26|nr:orotate phosphoribosyltransferase [Wolbachia endosymbiont of Howardula sp.]UWI83101.1 orotate phosphoribosyltransferase [Wolbachia endosymbiont of Howardula sp.]